MINYLKLHFNYLFSKLFISFYSFLLGIIFIGIIQASNLDLGFSYLDGFRVEYYKVFIIQVSLLVEVMVVFISIFIATILAYKTNDYLLVFSANNYRQRFRFYFSRIFVAIFVIFITILIIFVFQIAFIKILTPLNNDYLLTAKVFSLILLKSLYFIFLIFFFMSVINHFLLGILPIIIFWYEKMIYSYEELSDVQEVILSFIPSFMIIEDKIILYQELNLYLIFLFIILMAGLGVNLTKDSR